MLPAKRAGARGADPWHTLHREITTKVGVKQVEQTRHQETAINYARNKPQENRETATKVEAKPQPS